MRLLLLVNGAVNKKLRFTNQLMELKLMTRTLLSKNVQNLYESKMRDARMLFTTTSHLLDILAPDIEPAFLELFLIHFHALGVGMVEPVEGWIRRTRKRCEEMGMTELSRYCTLHESISSFINFFGWLYSYYASN